MVLSVLALALVARRRVAVHCLALGQLALQVSCHEIVTAHTHVVDRGEVRQQSQRRAPHGAAEGLTVVYSWDLSATLYAQTGLEGAVALDLVHPDQLDKAPAAR